MSSFLIYSFGVSVVGLCNIGHDQCNPDTGVPILVTRLIEELLRLLRRPNLDKFWEMDLDTIKTSPEYPVYGHLRSKVESQLEPIHFYRGEFSNSKWCILLALFQEPPEALISQGLSDKLRSIGKYFVFIKLIF